MEKIRTDHHHARAKLEMEAVCDIARFFRFLTLLRRAGKSPRAQIQVIGRLAPKPEVVKKGFFNSVNKGFMKEVGHAASSIHINVDSQLLVSVMKLGNPNIK